MSQQAEKNNHYLLSNWKPENAAFWEKKGKPIARRNLVISVACLLLAFCVWMLFSAVAVNLNLYRHRPAVRLRRGQLCLQHGQHQLFLSQSQTGQRAGH